MRLGQHVLWKSLNDESKTFSGTLRCFEHANNGLAIVQCDVTDAWLPIRKSRIIIPQPPAKFTAKGGGDDPAGSPALMAEVS
jgi:hypothetical protein